MAQKTKDASLRQSTQIPDRGKTSTGCDWWKVWGSRWDASLERVPTRNECLSPAGKDDCTISSMSSSPLPLSQSPRCGNLPEPSAREDIHENIWASRV